MAVSITRKSRLRFKDLVEVDGAEFWDLDNLPEIPLSASDFYYFVTQQDRMDLLATRFYGDPNLWWVIAVANDMNILPTNLRAGTTIRIPSPNYVNGALFSDKSVRQR